MILHRPQIPIIFPLLPSISSTKSLPAILTYDKIPKPQPRIRSRFTAFSSNNDGKNLKETDGKRNGGGGGGGGGDELRKERGFLFNFNWGELLLDPDPDNILAVALTGLLAWASVQVLWQLFFISLAILVAALKYSFIAALLIFILITLL